MLKVTDERKKKIDSLKINKKFSNKNRRKKRVVVR